MSRRHILAVVALALGVLTLVTGCIVFMEQIGSERRVVASARIDEGGGTITVEDDASPYNGLRLECPSGAFSQSAELRLSEVPAEGIAPPAGFELITETAIEIDAGGSAPALAVTLWLPLVNPLDPSEEALLVCSSTEGWDMFWAAETDEEAGLARFVVDHFSDFALAFGKPKDPLELASCSASGFLPHKDGLPIANYDGECVGMCHFAIWYFGAKASEEGPLRARFGSHEADEIATSAQSNLGKWDWYLDSEKKDVYEIIERIRNSGQPQGIGLAKSRLSPFKARHAVVAYRWDQAAGRLYCYDPNTELGEVREVAYVQVESEGAVSFLNSSPTAGDWPLVSKLALGSFNKPMPDIYSEWAVGVTEVWLSNVDRLHGRTGPVEPGDQFLFMIHLKQWHTDIQASIHFELVHESDLESPLYSECEPVHSVGPTTIDRRDELEALFLYELPVDAKPGKYFIRAAARNESYCEHPDRPYQVLYDVTGNGPNSKWQDGMWSEVFEISECVSDTVKPTVQLECPTPTAGGDVTLTWTGDDNCSEQLWFEYRLEGVDSQWIRTQSTDEKQYSGLSDGIYRFCVKAEDEAGNTSAEECCSVTVSQDPCADDTVSPTLNLSCGNPDASGNVSFNWSGSDNCSSILYQYKLTNKDGAWSAWTSSTSKAYSNLATGTYTFCVRAKDQAGNVSANKCCTVTVSQDPCSDDTVAPAVNLSCGTPDASGNVSFSWSGTDNCSSVLYQHKLANKDVAWSSWTSSTSKSYSNLATGTYTFCVRGRDEAGNLSEDDCCTITVVDGGPEPCPPSNGVTEFTGRIYQLGPPPIAWISDRTHVGGVDITQCYTGPTDVEVYCDSPCAGFVSPNLQVGDEVEVRGYFQDGGNGAWAEVYLDDPSYYLRKIAQNDCPPSAGVTRFVGVLVNSEYLYSAQERHEVSIVTHISGPDLSKCYGSIPVLLQWGDWYDPPDEGWVDESISQYTLVEVYGLFVPDPEFGDVVHLREAGHYLKLADDE